MELKKSKKNLATTILLTLTIILLSFFTLSSIGLTVAEAKTLIAGWAGTFDEWDPARISATENVISLNVYEPLVYANPPGSKEEISPCLATEWSVSNDKMSWTFKIRKGVKFHDGEPLNAEAVKHSINRVIEEKIMGYIWGAVKEIKVLDEYTVQFILDYPAPMDLIASAQYGASVICSPKAAAKGTKWFNKGNGAGTGPYKIGQWIQGQQVVLEKNPDYWGGFTDKNFDRVVMRIIIEETTRTQMLKTGEIHWAHHVGPETMQLLSNIEGITTAAYDTTQNAFVWLNYQKYPTDNKKFRQALTHIWDYERIIKEILLGYAELAKGPIPTTLWGANTNLDMPKFDLEKARKLLDESGIPLADRKIIILPESTDEEMKNACIVFQNDASKVGVKVEIEAGPFNAIVDRMRNLDNSAHAFLVNWPSAYPTPSDVLYAAFRTEDPTFWNLGHYANPEFDKALDQAIELEGTDREASIKKYHETQKILVEDAAAIFQSTYKMKVAFRSDIKGTYMNPNYWPPFFKNFYSDN